MTRDEADRIATNCNCGYVLEFLEKLGVVKFDEPEPSKPTAEEIIRDQLGSYGMGMVIGIINALYRNGYRVVDTDVYDVIDKRYIK